MSAEASTDRGGRAPARIAVIAVHGVADQQPHQTVRNYANVLTTFRGPDGAGDPPYDPPTERPLRIPVDEIRLSRYDAASEPRLSFQARAVLSDLEAQKADGDDIDRTHAVMQEQLAELKLPLADRVYETLRLETRRRNGESTCHVHVYEMYWADLSRLSNRVFRVVLDFFQLLFLLAVEGARTLGYTRAAVLQRGKHNFWWRAFGDTHALATRLLVLGFPALTLAFLGLLSAVLPFAAQALDERYAGGNGSILAVVPAVVAAVAVGALLYLLRAFWPRRWWISLVLVATAAVATWAAIFFRAKDHAYAITAVTLWLAFLAGVWAVAFAYGKRFRGASYWALAVAGVVTLRLFGDRDTPFTDAATRLAAAEETAELAIQWLHWPLWALFAVLCLLASVAAALAARKTTAAARQAAARATWTAIFTLSFSGIATFLVALALWTSLPIALDALPEDWREAEPVDAAHTALNRLMGIALPSQSYLLGLFLALAVALLLAVWLILPAALADQKLKKSTEAPPRSRLGESLLARLTPEWLGGNLSAAFRGLRVSGELVRLTVAVGLAVTAVKLLFFDSDGDTVSPGVSFLAFAAGTLFFVTVTGSHGPFRFLLLGFRVALDVALDVVNWLRIDPPTRTPAGRISSRYYSLLRYLSSWRADDGARYDAIVVFAHSQGTVITADLLRFLKKEWGGAPPGLGRDGGRLPIYFLTIGCPLRQLYARRFPYRYAWAQDPDAKTWQQSTACRPDDLDVRIWSNAYRSGDYIGRFLWHPEDPDSDAPWDPALLASGDGRRREQCIGFGGHGSYWGEIAPAVAAELDWLIRQACRERAG